MKYNKFNTSIINIYPLPSFPPYTGLVVIDWPKLHQNQNVLHLPNNFTHTRTMCVIVHKKAATSLQLHLHGDQLIGFEERKIASLWTWNIKLILFASTTISWKKIFFNFNVNIFAVGTSSVPTTFSPNPMLQCYRFDSVRYLLFWPWWKVCFC